MTEKLVADVKTTEHPAFDEFVATIESLRCKDGCPWDKAQTHQSIANNMIEEAYEAVDTIEANDIVHLQEELGDVLLQVVLHAQIATDEGDFTIDDVCRSVNDKIVRRHPHVFGNAQADDANAVLDTWDQIKLAEKKAAAKGETDNESEPKSLLDDVPRSFPALMQAQKISRKAASAGFEWETVEDVWDKVEEEIAELREAYAAAPKSANGKIDVEADAEAAAAVEHECGDVFFSLVNVARKMGVNAEEALRCTCTKFRNRWAFMEGAAFGLGRRVENLTDEEREQLWCAAKALE